MPHPGLTTPLWTESIAIVLLHFLWQAFVVAFAVQVIVVGCRLKRGAPQYAVYLAGFFVLSICPLLTWVVLASQPGSESMPIVATQAFYGSESLASQAFEILRPCLFWITVAWAVGAGFLSMRFAHGVSVLNRIRREAEPISAELLKTANRLAAQLGIRGRLVACASAAVREPMTFGWLRPVVVVPLSIVTSQSPDVLQAILAHEMAHIRRFDLWINAFQRVVESLLFFHPVVWWLSRRIREERELCCDALAVQATGARVAYATALERVATIRIESPLAPLALAMRGRGGKLQQRVRRVLELDDAPQRTGFAGVQLAVLIGFMTAAVAAFASQQFERMPAHVPTNDPAVVAVAEDLSSVLSQDVADQPQPIAEHERTSTAPPVVDSPSAAPVVSVRDETVEKKEAAKPAKPPVVAENDESRPSSRFDVNGDGQLDDVERKAIEEAYKKGRKGWSHRWRSRHGHSARDSRGRHDRHGDKHHAHGQSKHSRYFKQYDRDKDGRLDWGERAEIYRAHREKVSKWRKQIVAKYDRDGDGSLDNDEKSAVRNDWREKRKQKWMAFVKRYDINGDGRLDSHERMAYYVARRDRTPRSS